MDKEQKKIYMRSWRKEHRAEYNNYFKNYRMSNKDRVQAINKKSSKKFYEKFEGYYLYIITDRANNILYVGETTNIKKRMYSHLTCNSNIRDKMKQGTWKHIKYLDVTQLVKNEEELLMLENALIELYQPAWNKTKNNIDDVNRQRELELLSSLHSLLNVWEIYATNPD